MADKKNAETIELSTRPGTPEELAALIMKCYKEKPADADIAELRDYLREKPGLYKFVFDLADVIKDTTVKKIISERGGRLGINANILHIKNSMDYERSPIIEQMLIENIIITWLRYQWAEFQLSIRMDREVSISIIEWWEKRTSAAQRRYLRAIETLARVRKLARNTPALQVNIATEGGQQVNVGGDLNK